MPPQSPFTFTLVDSASGSRLTFDRFGKERTDATASSRGVAADAVTGAAGVSSANAARVAMVAFLTAVT